MLGEAQAGPGAGFTAETGASCACCTMGVLQVVLSGPSPWASCVTMSHPAVADFAS